MDFEITDTGIPKPTTRAPVVIFKLDDLTASSATELTAFSAPWNRLFDYSATKPLVISVGIIGNLLDYDTFVTNYSWRLSESSDGVSTWP